MTKYRKAAMYILAILLFIVGGLAVLGVLSQQPPDELGLTNGRLRECPVSPNCVCSASKDAIHAIEALSLKSIPADTSPIELLQRLMSQLPRTRLVDRSDTYLRYEVRSAIFSFVDDVEFLVDTDANVIHVRSASRVGHGDLNVNRNRIERIRKWWDGQASDR